MASFRIFMLMGLILCVQSTFAQERLSLTQFLSLVQKQNLDLKINQAKKDVQDAKDSGVDLPPPTLTFNQMQMEPSKEKSRGYEISQTIPFPTKLMADKNQRGYLAQAQTEKSLVREKEILAQAKSLYFNLWYLQEKLFLLKEEQKILENHTRLARSTARSDSFASVHVLKTESDLDLLDNEIQDFEQSKKEKLREVANFLNQDSQNFQILVEEPPLSKPPQLGKVEDSHQVKALQYELESFRSQDTKAKSEWLPDFMLSYKKMNKSSMYPEYSEVMVGVSLPFLFFWEPYGKSKASLAEKRQAQFELEKQKNEISAQKENLLEKVQILKNQILNLKEKTIPRAEKRIKLVRNVAPRDMETLQDHRDTMEALPKLKEKALELRVQYEKAISDLGKYF